MKYNVRVNRSMVDTCLLTVEANSVEDAESKAKNIASNGDNEWDECSTEYMIDDLTPTRPAPENHIDAFKVFDSSYVMDRKAQIDFLEGFVKAWDIMHGMNILSDKVIEAMTKELNLFYDANKITYDCAEAVLSRLLTQKEYKLQHVEFGSVVYEFVPDEDDYWESDGKFDYHYCEEYGEVCVYYIKPDGETDTSVTIHKQPIQK